MNITSYLEKIADSSDVSGGGSVAALVGASSTAMTLKVVNNEIKKQKTDTETSQMDSIQQTLSEIKNHFEALVFEDEESLQPLINAKKMPNIDKEKEEQRRKAIEESIEEAARPQIEILETLIQLFNQIDDIIKLKPSGEIVTNLSEAILFSQAAMKVSHIGALTNYESLSDEQVKSDRIFHINQTLALGEKRSDVLYQTVSTYLNNGEWEINSNSGE